MGWVNPSRASTLLKVVSKWHGFFIFIYAGNFLQIVAVSDYLQSSIFVAADISRISSSLELMIHLLL